MLQNSATYRNHFRFGPIYWLLTPLLIPLLLLLVICNGCSPTDPRLLIAEKIYLCSNYSNHACQEPADTIFTYKTKIPESKQENWKKLGNYLYFHTRETPGIRVEWNRNPTKSEMKELKTNLACSYRLVKGDLEFEGEAKGVRLDSEGFWCFEYLGGMLTEFHAKHPPPASRSTPQMDFFPVELEFHFRSSVPQIEGKMAAKLELTW